MQFDQKTIMVGISLLGTIGSMTMGGNQFSGMNKAREQYAHQREILSAVESSEELRLAQDKIARVRFENCEMLADSDYKKGFTFPPINKTTRVVDRHTGQPLAPGTVVCDGAGNAGILIDDGYVDMKTVVFTGDRNLVAKRIARYRMGSYSNPVIGGK